MRNTSFWVGELHLPLTSSLSLMTFSSRYSTSRFSAMLVVQFSRLLVTSICRLLKLFSASSTACTEDFVSRYGSTIYAAAATRFSFKNSIENKNQFQFNFFFLSFSFLFVFCALSKFLLPQVSDWQVGKFVESPWHVARICLWPGSVAFCRHTAESRDQHKVSHTLSLYL